MPRADAGGLSRPASPGLATEPKPGQDPAGPKPEPAPEQGPEQGPEQSELAKPRCLGGAGCVGKWQEWPDDAESDGWQDAPSIVVRAIGL